MSKKLLKTWKKVLQNDLSYLTSEMEDLLERPALLLMEGAVGAGKTTFGRFFIKQFAPLKMRSKDFSGSPTYSLLNDYGNIVHGDFYRIENVEELIHLELPFCLENKDFCLLEWGLKYKHFLEREIPEAFHFYQLDIVGDNKSTEAARDYFLYQLTRE